MTAREANDILKGLAPELFRDSRIKSEFWGTQYLIYDVGGYSEVGSRGGWTKTVIKPAALAWPLAEVERLRAMQSEIEEETHDTH